MTIQVSILLCLDTGWKPEGPVIEGQPFSFNPLMSGYGLEEQNPIQVTELEAVKMNNLPRHSKIFLDKYRIFLIKQCHFKIL